MYEPTSKIRIMSTTIVKKRLGKRLERLISSGICPKEDAEDYAIDLKQLADKVVDAKNIDRQNRLLKALANSTRLKILNLLQIREMCVCEIMVALGLTQPTASHHLNILENVGVVKDRKEGKWVFYSIAPNTFQSLFGFLKGTTL